MLPPKRHFLLSLAPLLLIAGFWLISTSRHDYSIFHFTLGTTLVEITSTSWRALEIAIVSNAVFIRGCEYCVLPKSHAPVLGMYLGPVQVPAPSRAILLLAPYYALFVAAALWPATLLYRAARRRVHQPGFAVEQVEPTPAGGAVPTGSGYGDPI